PLQSAVGRKVNYNGQQGTLAIDDEGNFIVDTGDTEYEIPASKDGSRPMDEFGLEFAPERRTRIDTDGSIIIDQVRGDQVDESTRYSFVGEGRNRKGDLVSVTLQNENGQNITIRDPKMAETIVFDLYDYQ